MQDGPFLGCVRSTVCRQCVFGGCVSACVSICGAYDCAVISQEEEPVQVQTAYLPQPEDPPVFSHNTCTHAYTAPFDRPWTTMCRL